MIDVTRHGDVLRLRMWTRFSAGIGYDVSAYLVHGTLIDSGFHHVRRDLLAALTGERVEGVIVTHWHEDHAGNAALLAARGLPMLMHADTERILRSRPRIKLYRQLTWGRPPAMQAARGAYSSGVLALLPAPGHSADHHVVWDAERGTLFSADLWLGVRARLVHQSENPYLIVDSLRRVRALRPERMFDAHRGPVENPERALAAKQEWLEDIIAAVEQRLDAGQSERAIVRALLGGEEFAAMVSQGEYSRRNLVRAIRRERAAR